MQLQMLPALLDVRLRCVTAGAQPNITSTRRPEPQVYQFRSEYVLRNRIQTYTSDEPSALPPEVSAALRAEAAGSAIPVFQEEEGRRGGPEAEGARKHTNHSWRRMEPRMDPEVIVELTRVSAWQRAARLT